MGSACPAEIPSSHFADSRRISFRTDYDRKMRIRLLLSIKIEASQGRDLMEKERFYLLFLGSFSFHP